MKIILIILSIVFVLISAIVKAVMDLSEEDKLKGKETTEDLLFNPIQDSLGRWVVSEEEIEQLTDSDYLYLKALPLIEFAKPRDTIKAW